MSRRPSILCLIFLCAVSVILAIGFRPVTLQAQVLGEENEEPDVSLDSLEFGYTIDESMEFSPTSVESYGGETAPVAAAQLDDSFIKRFVANEVIILSNDSIEVNQFIDEYDGELLVRSRGPAGAEQLTTMNVVKVDLDEADLAAFEENATQLLRAGGLGVSNITVSSEEGARLLSILTNGRIDGLTIYADVLGEKNDIITEYEESSGRNAWTWQYLNWEDSPKIGVPQMWSLLQYHRLVPTGDERARIAIHDDGFCFPDSFSPADRHREAGSEFHNDYAKFDPVFFYREYVHDDQFINDKSDLEDLDLCDYALDNDEYHGTNVASTALARSNNQFGAVGTVGASWARYAGEPYYAENRLGRTSAVRLSLSKTAEEGADIVNMSWIWTAWTIEAWSFGFSSGSLYEAIEPILEYLNNEKGMVTIAAAGNDGQNVTISENEEPPLTTQTKVYPCSFSKVLCVGGINSSNLDSRGRPYRHSSSNYGDEVDISAPFTVRVGWEPQNPETDDLDWISGTSFSAPFVTGISSMLWSIWSLPDVSWSPSGRSVEFQNPTPSRIESLLFQTSRSAAYEDSMSHGYVSALSAAGQLLPDESPEVQLLNGRNHGGKCYETESVNLEFGARGRDVRDYLHSLRPRLKWTVNGNHFDVRSRVSRANLTSKYQNEWHRENFEWDFSAYPDPRKTVQASMEDREGQKTASREISFTVRHGNLEMKIIPATSKIYVPIRDNSEWPVQLRGMAERKTCENPGGISPQQTEFQWIADNGNRLTRSSQVELEKAFFRRGASYVPRDVALTWTGPDDFIKDQITIVPCSRPNENATTETELCPDAVSREVERMENAMKELLLNERLEKILGNHGLRRNDLDRSNGPGFINGDSPVSGPIRQLADAIQSNPEDFDRRANEIIREAHGNDQLGDQGLRLLYRTVDVASGAKRFFVSQANGGTGGWNILLPRLEKPTSPPESVSSAIMIHAVRGYYEGMEKTRSLDDEMNWEYAAAAALFGGHQMAQEYSHATDE